MDIFEVAERKHRGSVLPGSAQLPARFPAEALVRVLQQFMLSLPRHRLPGFDFLNLYNRLAGLVADLTMSVQVAKQRASRNIFVIQRLRMISVCVSLNTPAF